MTVELVEEKKTRSRKQELPLSELEKKQLEASLEKAKQDIIDKRTTDADLDEQHKELWADRYRCKVTSSASRKGEKNVVLYVGHPTNRNKPHKLNIKLGEWIEEGLPMFVIERLQNAFDSESEERSDLPTGDAGDNHSIYRQPRFIVQLGKKVEAK